NGLGGEGFGQRDLFVGKWKNLNSTQRKRPDDFLLAHQRHRQNRMVAHPSGHLVSGRKFSRFGVQVEHMDRPAINDRTSGNPVPRYGRRFEVHWNWPMVRMLAQGGIRLQEETGIVCAAYATRRFRQGVEYLLQIEGRSADDFQDVSGSRLL